MVQTSERIFNNDHIRLRIREVPGIGRTEFYTEAVEIKTPQGWQPIAYGVAGQEFSTSLDGANASVCQVEQDAAGKLKRFSHARLMAGCRCNSWAMAFTLEDGAPRISSLLQGFPPRGGSAPQARGLLMERQCDRQVRRERQ